MNNIELFRLLEIPNEVQERLIAYGNSRNVDIPKAIFIATMKFCTRFLQEHVRTFYTYKFVWAWWFPRQISLNEYRIGALEYEFVEGETVKLTCDSWMLMPELKELLGEGSNIIVFQNLFEIDTVDYDATWYMGWIFPGVEKVDEFLPEKTRLQRNMKKYLLSGRKFGIAKGHLMG